MKARIYRWSIAAILIVGEWSFDAYEVAASNVIVEVTSGLITPQALAINQGDTIIWVFGQGNELDVRSYTGEWQSPFLGEGGTFSQAFTTPGEYVYGSHIKFGTIIGFNRGATIAV